MNNADQQFLEFVIKALVDNPDKVKVTRTVDEMGVLLTLDVDAADMGKIIGRQGNTAKSIRTLLRVVGMKNNSRVNLKINEPEGGLRSAERMTEAAAAPVHSSAQSASKTVDEAMADLKLG
ncbi:MAG: KH domain-containing protein [Patescibacteria group bacterium]|nr:KH domain-containing protein [Patescibacteria group bacterium]